MTMLFSLVVEDNDQCAWEGISLQHRLEQLNLAAQLILSELFPDNEGLVQWSVTPDGSIIYRAESTEPLNAIAVRLSDCPEVSCGDVTEVTPATPDPHSSPLTEDQQITYLYGLLRDLAQDPQPQSGPRPQSENAEYALDTAPAFITVPAKARFARDLNLPARRQAYYSGSDPDSA